MSKFTINLSSGSYENLLGDRVYLPFLKELGIDLTNIDSIQKEAFVADILAILSDDERWQSVSDKFKAKFTPELPSLFNGLDVGDIISLLLQIVVAPGNSLKATDLQAIAPKPVEPVEAPKPIEEPKIPAYYSDEAVTDTPPAVSYAESGLVAPPILI